MALRTAPNAAAEHARTFLEIAGGRGRAANRAPSKEARRGNADALARQTALEFRSRLLAVKGPAVNMRPTSSNRGRTPVDPGIMKEREVKRIHPEDDEYMEELCVEFPFQGYIANPQHRALTVRQLLRVARFASTKASTEGGLDHQWHGDPCQSDTNWQPGKPLAMAVLNFYHLDTWLIKPATVRRSREPPYDCCFAELLSDGPQVPRWFVSHWWGDRVADIVKCVEAHAKAREVGESAPYWICAFTLRQHSAREELPEEVRKAPFAQIIRSADGMLLVLNVKNEQSSAAGAFRRTWCVFEMVLALEMEQAGRPTPFLLDTMTCHGLEPQLLADGLTQEEQREDERNPGEGLRMKTERENAFPVTVFEEGLIVNVETTQAERESDRQKLLNCLAGRAGNLPPVLMVNHPSYVRVNQKLRGYFAVAAWRQAVEKNSVDSLKLPQALAADDARRVLSLNLSLTPLNGLGVTSVARGIPRFLRKLQLGFQDCEHIGDCDLATLASRLPPNLDELDLDFEYCERIGDGGAAALARSLPDALQGLTLSFTGCGELSDRGLAALAQGLPMGLRRADLRFGECSKVTDAGLAAFARTNAVVLRRLKLDFRKCEHVTSAGLAALARSAEDAPDSAALDGKAMADKRKLVLHFALPRTLMTCDMATHRTTEEELNSALADLAWGCTDNSGWVLTSQEPSLIPPHPTHCSYGDFVRKLYLSDPKQAEQKVAMFTKDGEPGESFRPFMDKMVKALSYSNNWLLAKAYDVKKVILNEEEVPEDPAEPEHAMMRFGRHQVLPSFWHLLITLAKSDRQFCIVFRSFSPKQLSVVQRELQFFCKGLHPAYSGQNKTRVPPRMNGEKGSKDLRLKGRSIGRMDRAYGRLKFLEESHIIGGSHGVEEELSPRRPAGTGAGERSPDEGESWPPVGGEVKAFQFPPYHELYQGLSMNVLGRDVTAAIIDDFGHWEASGHKASAGKLHVVDHNACLAETKSQHLFFDGGTRPGDAYCVDVRDLNSGEPLSLSEAEGLFLHRVDLYQACTDVEYFVKALEACEVKMAARCAPTQCAVVGGSCFPLSKLELGFQECVSVGDAGVAAVAQALPQTLQILSLNFSCCLRLGDAGLAALAHGLPPGLLELRLSLARCPKVGGEGMVSLMGNLPATLRFLSLDLQRCYGIKDPTVATIRRGLPPNLQELELDVQYTSVSNERKKYCRSLEDLRRWEVTGVEGVMPAAPAEPARPCEMAAEPARPALPAHAPQGTQVERKPWRVRTTNVQDVGTVASAAKAFMRMRQSLKAPAVTRFKDSDDDDEDGSEGEDGAQDGELGGTGNSFRGSSSSPSRMLGRSRSSFSRVRLQTHSSILLESMPPRRGSTVTFNTVPARKRSIVATADANSALAARRRSLSADVAESAAAAAARRHSQAASPPSARRQSQAAPGRALAASPANTAGPPSAAATPAAPGTPSGSSPAPGIPSAAASASPGHEHFSIQAPASAGASPVKSPGPPASARFWHLTPRLPPDSRTRPSRSPSPPGHHGLHAATQVDFHANPAPLSPSHVHFRVGLHVARVPPQPHGGVHAQLPLLGLHDPLNMKSRLAIAGAHTLHLGGTGPRSIPWGQVYSQSAREKRGPNGHHFEAPPPYPYL